MYLKRVSVILLLLGLHFASHAQTDYIPIGDPQETFLDRLDIKFRNNEQLRFSTVKPYDRKRVTRQLVVIDSLDRRGELPDVLTDIDRKDLHYYLQVNRQWVPAEKIVGKSDNLFTDSPLPTHLYENYGSNNSFVLDPMATAQFGKNESVKTYQGSIGLTMHGDIGDKVGFYGSYTYNQERDPLYVQEYIDARKAVPGIAAYHTGSNGKINYSDFRIGVTTHAGKHLDFQLAYDQFFIGEGFRSLYLSNFGSPYLFLKAHAQVGRVSYTTAVARTYAPYEIIDNGLEDQGRPSNYMVFHYVSWQATKWLKFGFYENNMFNNEKNGGIQLGMLNPFIFNRAMSQNVGNSGKSSIGLDFKANIAQRVSAYGTLLINEFVAKEFFNYGGGDWRNKHALQLGAKYVDAFSIKNLDLQAEYNWVRPYTYTDKWAVNNFVHYNQPLADPLGANFHELIGILKYRPIPKLYITGKIIGYKKGLDTTAEFATSRAAMHGGDLFRAYTDGRAQDENIKVGDGIGLKNLYGSLNVAYQLFPNLFVDGNFSIRNADIDGMPKNHTKFFSFGVRWNMARRAFDF
ncbi:MAG: hypothetical protein QM610_15385 [Chitinophagaceae bacterium]